LHLPPEPLSTARHDKLYVATRADLSVGYQIAQAMHAAVDLCVQHPHLAAAWHTTSNSLIVLASVDERALYTLLNRAQARGVHAVAFREPDLGDELTAVAFAPGEVTVQLCANLPLAGRNVADQQPALDREARLRDRSRRMESCAQAVGQSVLDHGRSVREHARVLREHLEGRRKLHTAPNWRLPSWVDTYRDLLAAALVDEWTLDRYLTLHDAGKPDCRIVDDAGRVHFPNHAKVSATVVDELYGDATITELVARDMQAHTLTAADVPAFAAQPTAASLLIAALAEIHSNAAMFGGIESTSFKIKWKHLDRRGRAICQALFGASASSTAFPGTSSAGGAA
jgi:peptidyl-tRNA hydrolase